MAKKDPYMLDPNQAEEKKESLKSSSGGVFCPKKNEGKPCAVCEKVSYLFNTGSEKDNEIAKVKMAKCNFYFGYVSGPEDKKAMILEVGKKVGVQILDGINKQGWVDIAHPGAKQGRMMKITKGKDGKYNSYSASPSLDKADWAVSKEALETLPDLDNIVEILSDPIKRKEMVFRISDINTNETFSFRMTPHWNNKAEIPMKDVWRHWGGVTQDEVDGKVEMNLNVPTKSSDKEKEDVDKASIETVSDGEDKIPGCFGAYFDTDDKECQDCKWFKKCGKEFSK